MIRRFGLGWVLMLLGAALPSEAVELDFYQLSWLDDSGGYVSQYSDWGRVEISFTSTDAGVFHPMTVGGVDGWGGFLNVMTDSSGAPDWNVGNLPIFFTSDSELDSRLPQGVLFDLGVAPGTPITTLNYVLTVDPTPLAAMPGGALQPSPVSDYEILVGGDNLWLRDTFIEGGGKTAPQPAKNSKSAEAGEKIGSVAKISVAEKSVATVNEDTNGCAPGAVARSIKYMSDAHSHVNVTDDAQKVYGDLRTTMGTTAGGTATSKILSGKNKYVADNKLPITSTQTTNFKKAMETLKNKGDVEMGVHWGKKADGTSLGAHRAFVSEIQEIQDAAGNTTGYVVKIIDDPKQGDGTAANGVTTLRFDAAGNLVQMDGKGTATGAKLINFQTEDVQPAKKALTVEKPPTTRLNSGEVAPPVPVKKTGEVVGVRYDGLSDKEQPGWVEHGSSQLVINPEGTPGPGESLDMTVQVTVPEPIELEESTVVVVGLGIEHLQADGTLGHFLSMLESEPSFFLENLVTTSSFFDITYMVDVPDEAPMIFRLHGEIDEALLGKVWVLDMDIPDTPPGGGPWIDSFFDVSFDLEVSPDAYGLIGFDTPLLQMQLTGEQVVPEPSTMFLLLLLGTMGLLRRRARSSGHRGKREFG